MSNPVYLIGLDAFDIVLLKRWAGEGHLPHFSRLLNDASQGRLVSSTSVMQGSIWPTFATACEPGEHGMYYMLQVEPRWHRLKRVRATDSKCLPFWSCLSSAGKTSLVIDVPKLALQPDSSSVQIVEWGAMDHYASFMTNPKDLGRQILGQFGRHILYDDLVEPRSPAAYVELLDGLVDGARLRTRLGAALLQEHRPDLFVSVYAESHPAGHYFWKFMESQDGGQADASLSDAILKVYQSIDESIGELIESHGEHANIIVFSGHGMVRDDYPRWLLEELLVRMGLTVKVGAGPQIADPQRAGTDVDGAERVDAVSAANRNAGHPRRRFKDLEVWLRKMANDYVLPRGVQRRLWIRNMQKNIDFGRTRAWALPTDLQGFIRINLEGREDGGIVSARDYDRVVDDIATTLQSLRNKDNDEPVVEGVIKTRSLYDGAPNVDLLPDICVAWKNAPVRTVCSDRLGEFDVPDGGIVRSGNHRLEGFFFAQGPDIAPGRDHGDRNLTSIGPTALNLLKIEPPARLKADPIPL